MSKHPHEKKPGDNDGLFDLLVGLTFNCPYDQSNPEDCPLFAIRKLSSKERFIWAKGLDADQIIGICENHWECLAEKQQAEIRRKLDGQVQPAP